MTRCTTSSAQLEPLVGLRLFRDLARVLEEGRATLTDNFARLAVKAQQGGGVAAGSLMSSMQRGRGAGASLQEPQLDVTDAILVLDRRVPRHTAARVGPGNSCALPTQALYVVVVGVYVHVRGAGCCRTSWARTA